MLTPNTVTVLITYPNTLQIPGAGGGAAAPARVWGRSAHAPRGAGQRAAAPDANGGRGGANGGTGNGGERREAREDEEP